MQHTLSCAQFLQKIFFLEQLLLATTGTEALRPCLAVEETVLHNLFGSHGTSGPGGIRKSRQQHPIFALLPANHKSFKGLLTQMLSLALARKFYLWQGGFDMFTLRLALLCSGSVSCKDSGYSLAN